MQYAPTFFLRMEALRIHHSYLLILSPTLTAFMVRLVFILLFIFYCLSCTLAQGQKVDPPYAEWIAKLSIKQDLLNKNFREVLAELTTLDSLEICQVFTTLKTKAPTSPPQLQIRLLCLEARAKMVPYGTPDCPTYRDPLQLLNTALNMSYEIEDDLLTFTVYTNLVDYYTNNQKFGQGVLYGLLAKELFEQLGKDKAFPISSILYNLSFDLYRSREYRASIDVILKMVGPDKNNYRLPEDTLLGYFNMFSWNTLGLAYSKLEIPDSAFMAFDSALALAKKGHYQFWTSLVTGNIGDVLFQQGKYDSAEVLLKFDYEGSIREKEFDNAGNSLQWLALIDLLHNKPDDALQKTREAQRLISMAYDPDYMARTLLTYTKVFARLGKADSVSYYQDKFLTLHDSIEQEASDARAEMVQQQVESHDNIHQIKSLNKEKEHIKTVRNFIILLILLLAMFGFMILNRQKLKLKVRRQEAMEEKRLAEQEAIKAKEQLNLFTHNLIEKTSLVETLQQQLMDRAMDEEQKNHIAELYRHTILTDEDWDHFKDLFEKVYPAFFYRLKQKVTDLTTADQRMAALSKLQLSNKEAANLLGIAPNSVIKARQRLRHRFNLEPDADLELYFSQSGDFD